MCRFFRWLSYRQYSVGPKQFLQWHPLSGLYTVSITWDERLYYVTAYHPLFSVHFTDYKATIRPRTSQTKMKAPLISERRGQVGSIPVSYSEGTGLEHRHRDWIFWRRLFMYFLSSYTQSGRALRQDLFLLQPYPFLIHWSRYHSKQWINTGLRVTFINGHSFV
jgi:hypothetical protein